MITVKSQGCSLQSPVSKVCYGLVMRRDDGLTWRLILLSLLLLSMLLLSMLLRVAPSLLLSKSLSFYSTCLSLYSPLFLSLYSACLSLSSTSSLPLHSFSPSSCSTCLAFPAYLLLFFLYRTPSSSAALSDEDVTTTVLALEQRVEEAENRICMQVFYPTNLEP